MAETDSEEALTCRQGVSAVEKKTEAGNYIFFSEDATKKGETRKSATRGDIMERARLLQVFSKSVVISAAV